MENIRTQDLERPVSCRPHADGKANPATPPALRRHCGAGRRRRLTGRIHYNVPPFRLLSTRAPGLKRQKSNPPLSWSSRTIFESRGAAKAPAGPSEQARPAGRSPVTAFRGNSSLGPQSREISGQRGGAGRARFQGAVTITQVFAVKGVVPMVGEHGREARVTSSGPRNVSGRRRRTRAQRRNRRQSFCLRSIRPRRAAAKSASPGGG